MRRLTLTFDNGPCPGATERILDILAERNLLATFFVVGDRLADPAAKRCAERAKDEGHWIGNHTMTHGEPLGLPRTPTTAKRRSAPPRHCWADWRIPIAFSGRMAKGGWGPTF